MTTDATSALRALEQLALHFKHDAPRMKDVETIRATLTADAADGVRVLEWVAEVFPDWTTLRLVKPGSVFAFNRETGRVYKVPHPDCPFVTFPATPPTGGADAADGVRVPVAWILRTGHGTSVHIGPEPPKCEMPEAWTYCGNVTFAAPTAEGTRTEGETE